MKRNKLFCCIVVLCFVSFFCKCTNAIIAITGPCLCYGAVFSRISTTADPAAAADDDDDDDDKHVNTTSLVKRLRIRVHVRWTIHRSSSSSSSSGEYTRNTSRHTLLPVYATKSSPGVYSGAGTQRAPFSNFPKRNRVPRYFIKVQV